MADAHRSKLSYTNTWLSIAALALLACAGIVAFSNGGRPPLPSPPVPLENAKQGPDVGIPVDASIPIRPPDTIATSAAATASTAAAPASSGGHKEDLEAKPSALRSASASSENPATPVLDQTARSTEETVAPQERRQTSLSVVHLHRVGSCQGRLLVSRDGIAFVPDEKLGRDGFTLKYKDFLPTLADSTLTIKSNSRTYRFKAAPIAGKDDDGSKLHDLVESIARFR